MSTEHKVWCTLHEGTMHDSGYPAVAIIEFRHVRRIHEMPVIGEKANDPIADNQWWRRVSSLNDAGDPMQPPSCGQFGYVHVWPAVKYAKLGIRLVHCEQWFTNPITEAEYGTHIAFDTVPRLLFLTREEWIAREAKWGSITHIRQSLQSEAPRR